MPFVQPNSLPASCGSWEKCDRPGPVSLPERLGRYRVEAELGHGAMGRVYLAHDPEIGRKVALKTIHAPEGLSPKERDEALLRFQREVRAAGSLSHPNIVTIYDLGRDPAAGTFIAMEYVQGESLAEFTRPGHLLPPRTVASVACQAADALSYAHRQGIVHRDIKPANLILVNKTTIKIADFGLAKPVGASLTSDGTLLGTPYYMAPEQVRGGKVDGRSDLFGLAVVVYELLTGKQPFRGDSISTVIYRIMHEPPVEPDLSRLEFPDQVKAFLARALAKAPEERFQSGDEFARALREAFTRPPAAGSPGKTASSVRPGGAVPPLEGSAVRKDRPAAAPPPPTPSRRRPRPPSPRRRRRRLSATPFLVLLVGVVAVVYLYREAIFQWVSPYLGGPRAASPARGKMPGEGPPAPGAPPEALEPAPGKEKTPPGAVPPVERVTGTETGQGEAGSESAEEVAAGQGMPGTPTGEDLLILTSTPPGAAFEAAGRLLPDGRLQAPAPGQTVQVHAVLGCREATRTLSADEPGPEIFFDLKPVERKLEITSHPSAAAVRVDGVRRGKTPTVLDLDGCKEHQVTLSRNEYRTWTRRLPLVDGRLQAPASLTARLVPLPRGTMVVPTPPYPVKMALKGGRSLKAGAKVSLVAGRYTLQVTSAPLMIRNEIPLEVPAEGVVTPEVNFPAVARLVVRAQPSNALIEVATDGSHRDLGPPPILAEELAAGTYTVKCTFQHNSEVQERTVTLAAGDNPPVVFVADLP